MDNSISSERELFSEFRISAVRFGSFITIAVILLVAPFVLASMGPVPWWSWGVAVVLFAMALAMNFLPWKEWVKGPESERVFALWIILGIMVLSAAIYLSPQNASNLFPFYFTIVLFSTVFYPIRTQVIVLLACLASYAAATWATGHPPSSWSQLVEMGALILGSMGGSFIGEEHKSERRWHMRQRRKAAERADQLELLSNLSLAVASSNDRDEVLKDLVEIAPQLAPAEMATIMLVEDNPARCSCWRAGDNEGDDIACDGIKLKGCRDVEEMLLEGKPIRRHQVDMKAAWFGLPRNSSQVRDYLLVPLVFDDRTQGGILLFNSQRSQGFTQNDEQLLESLASHAVVAVEKARLIEALRQSGQENASLYQALKVKEELRTQLLQKLINAQEDERRRIARELHDETSQSLTTLLINLEVAQMKLFNGAGEALNDSAEQVIDKIENSKNLVINTLDEIHNLVYDLRPTMLDDLGLVPALKWGVKRFSETSGIKTNVKIWGGNRRLPPQVETVLYRVALECLSNVMKHSEASEVSVRLTIGGSAIVLEVEDNGKGFDLSTQMAQVNGERRFGLLGIQERMALMEGVMDVDTSLGSGTKVRIKIPVDIYV